MITHNLDDHDSPVRAVIYPVVKSIRMKVWKQGFRYVYVTIQNKFTLVWSMACRLTASGSRWIPLAICNWLSATQESLWTRLAHLGKQYTPFLLLSDFESKYLEEPPTHTTHGWCPGEEIKQENITAIRIIKVHIDLKSGRRKRY